MKQYMLSVHGPEGGGYDSDEEMQEAFKAVDALNTEMQAKGAWVFGGGLNPPSSATVVQDKDGDILTTDGPYLEAKEHLGGFWVINAADLDEALAWASKATVACKGAVEVRPFQDEPEG
jgi:hypothetical protein